MNGDPPVDFEAKFREPRKPSGGYPLQLSVGDLMKNFVFATIQDVDGNFLESASGMSGHESRKFKSLDLTLCGGSVIRVVGFQVSGPT